MSWDKKGGPRIAFLGTGAQGASIGADFALAGLDVTFIEQWPDHVTAIREHGITVNLPTRTINAKVPALHLCQVAEIKEPFDVVFLVVKAYDTKWACQLIEPVLAPDGLVVGLQNGMTHEDIAAIVGRERTIGAVIEIASNMWVPGVTNRQNDHDTSWFALGALDPQTQPRVEAVADLLRNAGTVEVTDDIRSAKWMKLVVNAAELIPSAIINLPLGDAARTPGMLETMRAAGYEAMHAALADGARIVPIIGMPPVTTNDPERYVDKIFEEVLTVFSQADTLTTSLQDWRKGRRAEIQEVNGWVVDILKAHGRPASVNQRVMEIAYEIENGTLEARPENSKLLIEAYEAAGKR
ncbi:NAD(P)-binding domain-containing protein [Rhizobium sp. VS19-DR104.2]|uniref:ketopantoate reductase family protein n=1 Tax=unclassified Rhizobium TaxID=2613769 RepID=UPI001CC642F2|nr:MULTISPECIES: 2-dehydropantoate 2-reductase N-terminal domain-containing protein [unclassified Rhizobium]MBZ5761228.1 NAD(P)-binding domain-containing protein [Rhizobium sp. VS19-DR96]MBZ5766982.1 NAD(P)-binding domain-containing protein [Rhizobium sp. VS19-DR129.2]MBZ5774867.1 NAD(P)-binding domain-containing protein [Rhizobium sp. VS19-DRK62.2]MBZ5785660.1 NAD(P)-binding domain-containing protein [Rhizobium sp. VS19-DR121]MBZ5803086.1 NAD(P)-binding domain-containing protein [Rhizobium sp